MGKSKDLATGETRFVNTAGDTMTGTLVAGTRLQVGDSSITQQYPSYGYVADFQASSGTQTYISIAAPTASSLGDNGVIIGEDATDTYITQRGNKNIKLAKAGRSRWLGKRPSVRGVAMNPVDHPHGGGEGKTSGGRHPVTPWGKPTKGKKTRSNKSTDKLILRSRHLKKKR